LTTGRPSAATVYVIGAGLAGLSAAVRAAEAGSHVVLIEAAKQAGGRCRSYFDTATGLTIDNGNHLVASGNHAVNDYLALIGASDRLEGQAEARFDYVDLRDMARWTLRPNGGHLPWWVAVPGRRVPGTRLADYAKLATLLRDHPGKTIGEVIPTSGPLWDRLLNNFFLSALNTPAAHGSARLAGAIVRETLAAGGDAYRPRIAAPTLAAAFVDPALDYLRARGAEVRLGTRMRGIELAEDSETPNHATKTTRQPVATRHPGAGWRASAGSSAPDADHGPQPELERRAAAAGSDQSQSPPDPARATALQLGDERIALAPADRVILAVPPWVAAELLPGLTVPDRFHAIVNAHYAVPPPADAPPILAVLGGTAEWVLAHADRISVTVSGADALAEAPREEIARTLWADVCRAYGIGGDLPRWQIIKENRATFAATPEQDAKRPAAATRWANVALAGDWTQTGLPATIEGAVRSGVRAVGK